MVDYSDFLDAYAKHFNTKKNEEREIREAFRVFDRNEEGLIDANELKQIVTTRGERLSESEAKSLIKQAEVDSQGKIDYEGGCLLLILQCYEFMNVILLNSATILCLSFFYL